VERSYTYWRAACVAQTSGGKAERLALTTDSRLVLEKLEKHGFADDSVCRQWMQAI
jgi:hypothetical protein